MNTRRLAAILAADVVGYSRLIGADEAGTLDRLRILRGEVIDPLLAEYQGRIFKTTGDGLLAEFPSAVQALRCAMAIQDRLRADTNALQLRIGLHQGDVVVEGDDLLGDGINIAARIEPLAEPGGIAMSARVREDAAGKVPLEVEDLGTPDLKNIAQPVRVFRIRQVAAERPALALPDKPSLAVLPFQNMSGDPEQEYFVDGLVDDITTALSRIGWLFVIARNSAFTYKGRAVDIRQIGRELGVRYVLEGSVRRASGRVRITGQLIEAATGGHVWADRFDGDITDIFELQDKITENVVGAIEPSLQRAEIARAIAKPTASLDAYDLYLRALQQMRTLTETDNRMAVQLLRQAIERDPRFGLAKALAAGCIVVAVIQDWIAWGSAEANEGIALARAALADAPDDPSALSQSGLALAYLAHDLDAARSALDQAVALNGNSAQILGRSGWVRNYRGEFNVARDHFSRALRLSPRDPELSFIQSGLAMALTFGLPAEPERGLEFALMAEAISNGNSPGAMQGRIEALVELGRLDEAREAARRFMVKWPRTSISAWRRRWPHRPEVVATHVRMYRAAGFPE